MAIPLPTGSRHQLCHPRHQQTIIATLMLKSSMMTMLRACNQFHYFFRIPRVAIRQHKPVVKISNHSHTSWQKCTHPTLIINIIAIIIMDMTTTITMDTTISAPIWPMILVILLVRQPGSLWRRDSLTRKSDLNSTKKSKRWKRLRCVEIS